MEISGEGRIFSVDHNDEKGVLGFPIPYLLYKPPRLTKRHRLPAFEPSDLKSCLRFNYPELLGDEQSSFQTS